MLFFSIVPHFHATVKQISGNIPAKYLGTVTNPFPRAYLYRNCFRSHLWNYLKNPF